MSEPGELLPSHALRQWVEAQKALDHAMQHYLISTISLRSSLESGIYPLEALSVRHTLAKTWGNHLPIPDTQFKLAHAQLHLNRIHNSLLLINTLPLEILVRIFTFTAFTTFHAQYRTPVPFSYQEDDHRDLFGIAHVCSHWRRVLLNTPSFWSYFALTFRYSLDTECERAEEYLSRAHGIPQSLSIYENPDRGSFYPRHSGMIDKIIKARLGGLTQISLRNFRGAHLVTRTVTSLFTHIKPGVLRALIIHMEKSVKHPSHIYVGNNALAQQSESMLQPVRVLSLRGITFPWYSSVYRDLVVLHIGNLANAVTPAINQILAVLSGCPRLHTLRLYFMRIYPGFLENQFQSIYLNELEYLDLAVLPPESIDLLLRRIFPQNKDLSFRISFSKWGIHDFPVVYAFLARTNVTRLFIDQFEGLESGNVLGRCLSGIPNLHTLLINLRRNPGDSCLSGLYLDETSSRYMPRCPKLHTVYFVTGSVSAEAVHQLVESHPLIRKLRFVSCYVEPFEDILRDELRPFVEDVQFDSQLDVAVLFDWYHLMS